MSGSLDLCGSPRCTAPTTAGIHVAGGSSVLQLPASAGCQHAVPSLGEIRTILSGPSSDDADLSPLDGSLT